MGYGYYDDCSSSHCGGYGYGGGYGHGGCGSYGYGGYGYGGGFGGGCDGYYYGKGKKTKVRLYIKGCVYKPHDKCNNRKFKTCVDACVYGCNSNLPHFNIYPNDDNH